mmetsp:Transcript_11719/g.37311  ORF Transcript_11719/g.37311 Transcript_11719/m.37311 type:complete len:206 (-) Transcript_11719:144-761(-)
MVMGRASSRGGSSTFGAGGRAEVELGRGGVEAEAQDGYEEESEEGGEDESVRAEVSGGEEGGDGETGKEDVVEEAMGAVGEDARSRGWGEVDEERVQEVDDGPEDMKRGADAAVCGEIARREEQERRLRELDDRLHLAGDLDRAVRTALEDVLERGCVAVRRLAVVVGIEVAPLVLVVAAALPRWCSLLGPGGLTLVGRQPLRRR